MNFFFFSPIIGQSRFSLGKYVLYDPPAQFMIASTKNSLTMLVFTCLYSDYPVNI